MSNFPTDYDDDVTLPPINDNLEEEGPEAINALREAVLNIENNIGLNANGSVPSIADRLGVSIDPDGALKSSALTSLGLVTLPITNTQIADAAGIPESKLTLDHASQDLFNYITDVAATSNSNKSWISLTGIKLNPHIFGTNYNHTLSHINVSDDASQYFKNKFELLRDNTNSFTMLNDLNSDLVQHQRADGSGSGTNVTTFNGSTYPSNYSHYASGIFINTDRFTTIPQTAEDLQQLAEYIDSSSIFLIGSRIQNLYANGIPRAARSSTLPLDGYGQSIVPETPAIAYLLNAGLATAPFDNISSGDDIIEFKPLAADIASSYFDSKFANVRIGDIVRVNYGTVQVQFVIKEKKYIQSGGNKKYFVRIAGKNLFYSPNATARIDKPLFNTNKFGVLAVAQAHNVFSEIPSLIVGNPRGAQAVGLGFDPDKFDSNHYMLYLALYTTGNPVDGYTILPGIDVTGNAGATPGKYTLQSIVESTNDKLRTNGYNYRFIAFSYKGEFGISLADPYNNTSFSILNGIVDSNGEFDQTLTELTFPKNVVGLFSSTTNLPPDPLGFGANSANIASPPFLTTFESAEASQFPTKLFVPLKRNAYYVNGIEKETLNLEIDQVIDQYGDGYWDAIVTNKNIFPGVGGRVQTTYRINLDLSSSGLKPGKTLVAQYLGDGYLLNFGRFIIESVSFDDCDTDSPFTDITVYDAVHATAISPSTTFDVGSAVAIYFNSDSVSFNQENSSDFTNVSPFRRYFEVYVDQNAKTFTHERSRINIFGSTLTVNGVSLYGDTEINKINVIKVSPKLRGYSFDPITKITLHINSYVDSTTIASGFDGYLCSYDGSSYSKKGPLTFGRKGQVVRFYDETNIDYVDVIFDANTSVSDFTNKNVDIQLFSSLSLDEEVMLIATCQLDDTSKRISYLFDDRQFGNTSEKQFTTSALDYISLPEKLLHQNGLIRGFDLENRNADPNPDSSQVFLSGGMCLVNGKLIQINNGFVNIPIVKESFLTSYNINWAICVNSIGEYQPIPLLDYDPILGTPTLTTRSMKLFNPAVGNTYYVDATTFQDLVDNRKDLCPLYIVAATVNAAVSPATISLQINDVRRFVNDVDSNLPLRYRSTSSFGNFESISSILNYLRFNSSLTGNIFLRGISGSLGTYSNNYTFDFDNLITIDGENNASITFPALAIFGSNITFKNVDITLSEVLIVSCAENITFENCTITATNSVVSTLFSFSVCNNINFIDCDISITYTTDANDGAGFLFTNCTNVNFIRNTFDITFSISPGTFRPGYSLSLHNPQNFNITDSTFTGNFVGALKVLCSSGSTTPKNINFNKNTITSIYNPATGPDFDYDTADLVNSGHGFVYLDSQDIDLSYFNIDGNTFNFSPTTASTTRFSFVNIEFSQTITTLSNFSISRNSFNSTNIATTQDDIRSAVSIINQAAGAGISVTKYPTIQNFTIDNNICNKNQSIVLTSVTDSGHMEGPGLVAQNVVVSNNYCGSIGYWVSSDRKTVNLPALTNSYNDKANSLVIYNNVCHLINNVDEFGKYFVATRLESGVSVNTSEYPSGYVTIKNNKANWIHTSITYEENSNLLIDKNNLSGYDSNFLLNFTNDVGFPAAASDIDIAFIVLSNVHDATPSATPSESSDCSCIISGNTTETGYWLLLPSALNQYKYASGYVDSQSSAKIMNNIFKGIDSTTSSLAIFFGGSVSWFTNNSLYTYGKDTSIRFLNGETPSWDGEGSYGLIVDNFFDTKASLRLVAGTTALVPPANASWTFDRNINQVGYALIPITSTQIYAFGALGIQQASPFTANYFIRTASSSTSFPSGIPATTSGYRSNILRIHDSEAATQRKFGWQENINKYIPFGARLLSVSFDINAFGTPPLVTTASDIFLLVNKYEQTYDYSTFTFSTVTQADPNVVNAGTAPFARITGTEINASSFVTKTIDFVSPSDISHDYKSGRNYDFGVSIDFEVERDTSDLDMLISPIRIEYTW